MDSTQLNFEGQRPDETIIMVARQHPWTLAPMGFVLSGLVSAAIITVFLFKASAVTSWVLLGGGGAGVCWGFYHWFSWWNTLAILTNERILLSDQSGLFSRKVMEIPLGRIQDVAFKVSGLSQTLLNYGSLTIKTASSEEAMRIKNIARPYQFQQKVMETAKVLIKMTQ